MNDIIEYLDIEKLNWEYNQPLKNNYRRICDFEESILSCLLQKPELMDELIVDDTNFYKYKKIFKYFKLFYETFNCLDLVLMINKLKSEDKYILVEVFDKLKDFEPCPNCFKQYEEGLIQYNKEHRKELEEQQRKDEILKLSLKLSHDEITLYDFYEKIGDLRNVWQENV